MSTTTPRHARSFPRFGRKASPREGSASLLSPVSPVMWTPRPLDDTDVASQAARELGQIAARRQDAWAGSRDTDRRA